LAEVIGFNWTLERLELSSCHLGDEGMAALAAGIGRSRSLQHLDVSSNSFGVPGATALTAAISTCPTLTSLIMNDIEIGDEGLAALAPALVHVRSLMLNDCSLQSQSGESLAWLIQSSRALQLLDVGCNQFVDSAVMETSDRPSNRTRRTDRFQPSNRGACALAASLEQLDSHGPWPATEPPDLSPSRGKFALSQRARRPRLSPRRTLDNDLGSARVLLQHATRLGWERRGASWTAAAGGGQTLSRGAAATGTSAATEVAGSLFWRKSCR
jgi:hypothetical protein